jgi:thiol-disulfide isomerase/thioredoxin
VLLALAGVAALLGAVAGEAAGRQKFDKAAFATAQAAGGPILVHVSAPWCPTCRAQKTVLDLLSTKPEFKDIVTFEVDFDTGGETLKAFNVRMQSTLIVFKGDKETGRSTGETKTEAIEALLKTAL